ncbi:thioesterase II family protein [Halalkalibacterium halodurans]|uniref:thioesterase II family protein n=1 Tax=Halalkalibacterium halodurans TaxID=86665 RepID=UPI0006A9B4F2|nr:alpha/beta fold hydrolase [Halalkalibacterium halodurans]MED4164207.1 alpha/beta fold hydrolase [Halalkalibacterium halodurans]
MQLFCFHCAGGSSSLFNGWGFSGIETIPLDLPGRGRRIREPFHTDFQSAAQDLAGEIQRKRVKGQEWGVFGHSLGAMLAYEVTRIYQDEWLSFRILSGVRPLHQYKNDVSILKEDDRTMIQKLVDISGIPSKYADLPAFVQWFAPIVRSDLLLVKSFRFVQDDAPISTYVLNGTKDLITRNSPVIEWRKCWRQSFHYETFEGDHFHILKKPEIVERFMKMFLGKVGEVR